MEFLQEIQQSLNNKESVTFLLILFVFFLFGLMVGLILWGGRAKRNRKEAKQFESDLQTLQIEHNVLKEQADLKEADLIRAEREAEESRGLASGLEKEKGKLQADLTATRDEADSLKMTAKSYADRLEDLNHQIIGLKTQNTHMAEEVQKEENALNQLAQMQSSYNATINRLAAVESKLENIATENETLKTELTEVKTSTENLALQAAAAPVVEEKEESDDKSARIKLAQEAVKNAVGEKIVKADATSKDNLTLIKGIGTFIEQKLNNLGICNFDQISQFDEVFIDQVTEAIEFFPGRIKRDDWVGQAIRLNEIKKENPDALDPANVFPGNPEDLKVIEGIGPKIQQLLKNAKINTWQDLAKADVGKLQGILNEAGDNFRIHDPSTWPMQAQLASDGEWEKLKDYQDFLIGGRDKGKK